MQPAYLAKVNPPDGLPVMAGPIYANRKCNIPPQRDDLGTYKGNGGGPTPDQNGKSDNGGGNGGN